MYTVPLPDELAAVCHMPVVADLNPDWKLEELESVLLAAHGRASTACFGRFPDNERAYTCLSGGLDSSLSLSMLRKAYPDSDIMALTIGGSMQHADVLAAPEVAKAFNASHLTFTPCKHLIDAMAMEMISKMRRDPQSEGDLGVFIFYALLAELGIKILIAHDGIDELMGGYWEHTERDNTEYAFHHFWQRLAPDHLEPLLAKAHVFGIKVVFPYLDAEVVQFISHIPLHDRTSRDNRKTPLRELARRYGVPERTITRAKKGFCDILAIE